MNGKIFQYDNNALIELIVINIGKTCIARMNPIPLSADGRAKFPKQTSIPCNIELFMETKPLFITWNTDITVEDFDKRIASRNCQNTHKRNGNILILDLSVLIKHAIIKNTTQVTAGYINGMNAV